MPRKRKITLDLDVWQSMRDGIQAERDGLVAYLQQVGNIESRIVHREERLQAIIDRLTRENAILKNCLCEDCRRLRNEKKGIKVKDTGLQL